MEAAHGVGRLGLGGAGDIRKAVAEGFRDVNEVKRFTRCGMGQCQGRKMCIRDRFEALRETYKNAPKEQQEAIFANGLAVLNRQMELETRAAAKSVNDIIAEEVGKWRKSNGVMLVISRSAVIDGDWDSACLLYTSRCV